MRISTTLLLLTTAISICISFGLAAPPSSSGSLPETYPSIVDSRGHHMSYRVHLASNNLSEADMRTFFKLEAFGKQYLLNVSSSAHFLHNTQDHLPVVEYIGADGFTRSSKTMNHSRWCFHSGHVHLMAENGEYQEETLTDGWVAISSCSGLHGVLATSEGYILIEPSESPQQLPLSGDVDSTQSHLVYRHTPSNFHSDKTCFTTHTAGTQQTQSFSSDPILRRRKRSFDVDEYFVETAIVADQSMFDYHRKEDLEAYIYTLMNIVTHLYREPSIGQPVNIVLVRTIILEKDPATLVANNAFVLLNSFCEWQHSFNRRNSPHHDIAIMITRKEICEGAGNNCGTLGMADIASICNSARSCNVNKDIGLSTAFTIAHEMGHNLGIHHDGVPQTQSCDANMKYIMAPSFAESMNPHMWSECSRQQLTNFLRSSNSACLDNHPSNGGVALEDENTTGLLLPGMEYTPTEQCQLQYGNGSTHCQDMQNECQYLWCQSDGGECVHSNNPPAPGTECHLSWGDVGVCFQSLCMELSLVSEPRDGGWGQWGSWGNCSLSCGTGIQYSDRECDSPIPANGGRYCRGQSRRYRTCNTHSCPEEVDFRKQLCMENPPNNRYRSWEAPSLEHLLHLGEDMCISHCVPTGMAILHTTQIRLPDGAPCLTKHSRGVCVSGTCRPIGCDHQLNVLSWKDECGVWCANGTSCVSLSGTFKRVDHPGYYRYYPAVTIPSGSTKITIEEVSPSHHNFIALLASPSGDTVNGNYNVLPNGLSSVFVAGASWTYERSLHATELLKTDGPVNENVTVYLLANSNYDGIRYTFSVPQESVNEISESLYYWNESDWSECSMECGPGGVQDREISCTKLHPNGQTESVNISFCNPETRPDARRPCNPRVCVYEWETGEWSMCDSVCGEGRQSRTVQCKWAKRNGTYEDVVDTLCNSSSEPSHFQPCQVESCFYEWHTEEWGKCDSLCGEGWMEREVVCLWMNLWLINGSSELKAAIVSDSHCGKEKPEESMTCDNMEPCEHFQWITSEWSECDAPCSTAEFQFRTISCQHQNGTELPSPFCAWQDTPEESRQCQRDCPTTLSPPPTTISNVEKCRNRDSDFFCNQVAKFSLCHVYRDRCCESCASD